MINHKRLVVITGATRGLGKLIAQRFLNTGADLILISRNIQDLKKTEEEFFSQLTTNQKIFSFPFNLKNIHKIPELIQQVKDTAGNPDILVNNAAIQGPIGPVYQNEWDEWLSCVEVCLFAPVQLTRGFLPGMIKKGYGRIINVSGGGATSPRPNFSSYATAKSGLVRFSETIAHEVASMGITVNCVSPGIMSSNITQEIIHAGKECAGNNEYETAIHLLENNSHNEDLAADLVYFLTTQACDKINGKLISAVWDIWKKIPDHSDHISKTDLFTLRRIIPEDRDYIIE